MKPESFIYWLHGYFEISESNTLSEKQVQVIKDHLDLCFNKVTPDRSKEEWVQPYFVPEQKTETENPSGFYPIGSKNTNDYYVTVSKNPNFDSARYSAYSNNCIITNSVRAGLEAAGMSGNFALTIDDSLNPIGQYAKGLAGGKDMIRGLPLEGPGIVNIGFGTPTIC